MKKKITIEGIAPVEAFKSLVRTVNPDKFTEFLRQRDIEICGQVIKVEHIPETFDEVQILCERYRNKHEFEAHKDFTVIDEFAVRNDGSVWLYYENIEIQTELTPARQWQIIKNLVEE